LYCRVGRKDSIQICIAHGSNAESNDEDLKKLIEQDLGGVNMEKFQILEQSTACVFWVPELFSFFFGKTSINHKIIIPNLCMFA
jgi:hypothetical protein